MNFRGDLTDNSAKKEALLRTHVYMLVYIGYHVLLSLFITVYSLYIFFNHCLSLCIHGLSLIHDRSILSGKLCLSRMLCCKFQTHACRLIWIHKCKDNYVAGCHWSAKGLKHPKQCHLLHRTISNNCTCLSTPHDDCATWNLSPLCVEWCMHPWVCPRQWFFFQNWINYYFGYFHPINIFFDNKNK